MSQHCAEGAQLQRIAGTVRKAYAYKVARPISWYSPGQMKFCPVQSQPYQHVNGFSSTSSMYRDEGNLSINPLNISSRTARGHWKNTFISASRAMDNYLLDIEDLEDVTVHILRSAHEDARPMDSYLKSDVEKRALEVWGSWQVLEHELNRRRVVVEEEEARRKGLNTLIAHLKKLQKHQTRKDIEFEMFGGRRERVSLLRGSAKVVLLAIASNFAVFVFKALAYQYSGSAAMLSEAVHSLADMLNQCLLAFGIAQSIRSPDPDHPYGWSRVRYVYSLISGVGIFFLGAGVTCYHGVTGLIQPHVVQNIPLALSVLSASAIVEGLTLWAAVKQVQKSAIETGVSFKDYVLRGRDPSAVAVLMEDSAAVAGVFVAATALCITHWTGNTMYDAIGSISIGGLLGVVALFLIQRNSSALVGRSIPPERLKQLTDFIESDVMIRSIHDVKATDMGADSVRFKAEVNFDGREVARVHINRLNLEAILKEVQGFGTVADVEKFLLEHGEQVIDVLGSEVDRVESEIKKQSPEVRHVDLEIL
ncbi:proton-coupled zinc antiporter SLC30A9, mitochondrial-like isoform X2 [Halichondria panicea]|uniref:proton-coupled zinc antiporter SLC30A9, mitochondrial-like isoform X2 n=1 Tax=Halichondria panicea TaxID=6063 RepID=UPI00312B85D1